MSTRFLTLLRGLILARLLGPDSYGLVASVFPFVLLASLLGEFGFGSYLVYRANHARSEASELAVLSGITGLAATGLLALSAPWIATFYGRPELFGIALALSFQVVFGVLSATPIAMLRVELKLGRLASAQIGAEMAGLAVGLPLAITIRGAWPLVISYLVSSGVTFVLTWLLSGVGLHRRNLQFALVWNTASRYGLGVISASVLWLIALQGDNVIVGRVLGASNLGLYSFAYNFGILPGTVVAAIIGQVAFPAFALTKSNASVLQDRFRSFVNIASSVNFAGAAIAIAVAGPAVRWLLGERWENAVVPLQICLVMGAIRAMFPAAALLRSLGRVWVEPIIGLITAPLVLIAALAGASYGIGGVALGVACVFSANELVVVWVAARVAGFPLQVVGSPFLRVLPALFVGAAAYGLATVIPGDSSVKTVGGVGLGIVLYFVALVTRLAPGAQELEFLLPTRWRSRISAGKTP